MGSPNDCRFAHLARRWRWIGSGAPFLNGRVVVTMDKVSGRRLPNSADVSGFACSANLFPSVAENPIDLVVPPGSRHPELHTLNHRQSKAVGCQVESYLLPLNIQANEPLCFLSPGS